MRYRVFLDTNILLSGLFFEGNESRILDLVELDIMTSEDVVDELRIIVKKKLKYLKNRTLEIALAETEKALTDIEVIPRAKYNHKLKDAESLITHKKDVPILATVLYVKPDYFLTGDAHFFADKVRNIVNVSTAKDFLAKIK
ncbi:MAG: putative toxin-antitoxin system toxin component, PIN family [Nitrospiraceae bacterium]|nr:putative toxin-antitoxin system toxin component, PIN family [Nitrospiraceae bacterium]